jgi:hypothetical protein
VDLGRPGWGRQYCERVWRRWRSRTHHDRGRMVHRGRMVCRCCSVTDRRMDNRTHDRMRARRRCRRLAAVRERREGRQARKVGGRRTVRGQRRWRRYWRWWRYGTDTVMVVVRWCHARKDCPARRHSTGLSGQPTHQGEYASNT